MNDDHLHTREKFTPPPPQPGKAARSRPSGPTKEHKFKLVPFMDITFATSGEWAVKKILPIQGLATLYGQPRAFKSFVALDIAFHVALGWDWAGRATTQGEVVYIAAENAGGTRKRKIGFELAHDDESARLRAVLSGGDSPEPRHREERSRALIASVEASASAPRLIVIDTLAQTLDGGEENNTGMVNFVANATALAAHFKSCVIAVHHVPLADDKRLRGHTSLHGGADAQLLTERNGGELTTTLIAGEIERRGGRLKLTVHLDRIVHRARRRRRRHFDVGGRPHRSRRRGSRQGQATKTIPLSRRLLMEMIAQAIDEAGQDLRSFPDGPLVQRRPR